MSRRFRGGGKPTKPQRRKRSTPNRRNAPKAMRDPRSGTVIARLSQERDEALLRETANSEILRLISRSPGDLGLVFRSILENATRICEAKSSNLYGFDGKAFYLTADLGTPPAFAEFARQPRIWGRDTALGQITRTKQTVHIVDALADRATANRDPGRMMVLNTAGSRTILAVPMLRENELIGAFIIFRQVVRPFTEKQIELVQNFAAQAVIAIENARLLNELRQSLEQQTASADVLRIISSSPGELQPIFEAMLQNAVRICDAKFGNLALLEGDGFQFVAQYGAPAKYRDVRQREPFIRRSAETSLGRVIKTKQVVHVADIAAEEPNSAIVTLGGARTLVNVPMLKENELVGNIAIYRQEVRPFTDKQIELVQNFAAQAVIAVENARLLNELRQRTADLSESLEQQTATAEILKVVSSSPGELQPVFDTILQEATRVCQANFGLMIRYEERTPHPIAFFGVPQAFVELAKRGGELSEHAPSARVARTKQIVHVADFTKEYAYAVERHPMAVAGAEIAGIRTLLVVPMLKEGDLIGNISIYRQKVRPFTDKQIALVQNFAAQAVIAIENARLLKELRERTEQLEAQSQEVAKLNQQLEQRVADQVGEIERMGRLRRFLPPQVADLIVASGTEKQLESHRREITALFCDLRGFTGFSESSDPEDVMALLAEYHAAIGTIINKYSGTLERYAGDGVMVIFNDPVPVENPALQAVLMALDMRAAIGGLIEKWRDLGHDLGFGIGIAHGFATLGTIGFEGRRDYAAIGTVSNVASRLCDEAKPGQILISPRVRQAVDKAVRVESVGEFELKGIRRPMLAYNVLESSPSKPN
jgi:class 3 adenylate cyclase/putative methionine-R-sulfoxide reductase with GAF domain